MAVGDRRVFTDDQFGVPFGLMGEVFSRAGREPRDPIASADGCVRLQMHEIQMDTHGEVTNPAVLLHDQVLRDWEAKAQPRRPVDFVAVKSVQHPAPQRPRQAGKQRAEK